MSLGWDYAYQSHLLGFHYALNLLLFPGAQQINTSTGKSAEGKQAGAQENNHNFERLERRNQNSLDRFYHILPQNPETRTACARNSHFLSTRRR
jgi:hypothetical protein